MGRLDGRIDVLVNNAGLFEPAPIGSSDAEWEAAWERTLRINLRASADLCRLAVLHFRERGGGGRIVNVASRAAYRGDSPDHWHYAASKAGMVAMTKTIARAYAGEGIYAFTVCPGLHRHRHGRGIYREPRRPRFPGRPADRPPRDHRRDRRDGALAGGRTRRPPRPAR